MERLKLWLGGLIVAAIFAFQALPIVAGLFFVTHGPLSDRGGALIAFISEIPEDRRIVAYEFGDRRQNEEAGIINTVPGPSGRCTTSRMRMAGPEGRRNAEIRYRIGPDGETRIFHFGVDLVAHHSCEVVVTFREDGPRASSCTNQMPAYDGVWLD